jgi:hypothetical protein
MNTGLAVSVALLTATILGLAVFAIVTFVPRDKKS